VVQRTGNRLSSSRSSMDAGSARPTR
jgi:hypothetical protein